VLNLELFVSVLLGCVVASTLGMFLSFYFFKFFIKGKASGMIKEMVTKLAGFKLEKVEYLKIIIVKKKKEIEAKVKIRLK